jgi:DNA end-binding protein Ku
VSAVEAVIKKRLKGWSPDMVSDPIQESLLKLIANKKKATKPMKANALSKNADGDEKSNVVNIMDALKKSVAKELKSRKAG